jgi:hypothetical protein
MVKRLPASGQRVGVPGWEVGNRKRRRRPGVASARTALVGGGRRLPGRRPGLRRDDRAVDLRDRRDEARSAGPNRAVLGGAERRHRRPVVPTRVRAPRREPVPHDRPRGARVGQDGAGVVRRVGRRDQAGRWRGRGDVGDVGFLARPPRRVRRLRGVSEQPGTASAARSPKRRRMRFWTAAPPRSSAASCRSAAISSSSLAPYARPMAATAVRWAMSEPPYPCGAGRRAATTPATARPRTEATAPCQPPFPVGPPRGRARSRTRRPPTRAGCHGPPPCRPVPPAPGRLGAGYD